MLKENKDEIIALYIQTEINLNNLRTLSANTNYSVATERKVLFDTVLVIKQCLKEVECLILGVDKVTLSLPAMRMYIKRNIHPSQMEAWVTKLYKNTNSFLAEITDKEISEHVLFISKQYKLLDSVIKVLNGDAYLVGCSHSN